MSWVGKINTVHVLLLFAVITLSTFTYIYNTQIRIVSYVAID